MSSGHAAATDGNWAKAHFNNHPKHALSCLCGPIIARNSAPAQSHQLHSTAQRSSTESPAAQHNTAQRSSTESPAAQHSTARCSSTESPAAQHSTAQHGAQAHDHLPPLLRKVPMHELMKLMWSHAQWPTATFTSQHVYACASMVPIPLPTTVSSTPPHYGPNHKSTHSSSQPLSEGFNFNSLDVDVASIQDMPQPCGVVLPIPQWLAGSLSLG